MRTSPIAERQQRTAGWRVLATLALQALACAASAPPLPPQATPPADGLRVELRFGAEADLDLYVTDPFEETVYFANTPSRRGGALQADLRCDAPAPRVETVLFENPPPGRYRVGVDFPARCRLTAGRAAYTIVVRGPGLQREIRGEVGFGSFESIAMEFVLAPEAGALSEAATPGRAAATAEGYRIQPGRQPARRHSSSRPSSR